MIRYTISRLFRSAFLLCAAILLIGATHNDAIVEKTEAIFLDFLDADSAVGVIDSGLYTQYLGHDRAAWDEKLRDRHSALLAQLAAIEPAVLSPADAAAIAAMRVTLRDHADPSAAVSGDPDSPKCADAARDRKSTRLNSSHSRASRMPSSA